MSRLEKVAKAMCRTDYRCEHTCEGCSVTSGFKIMAQAALSALDEGWTDEVPTVPGWYWRKGKEGTTMAYVCCNDMGWWHWRFTEHSTVKFTTANGNYQWSGPIPPPQPEGDK